jgi:uncharacterized repeat protein (TIGR03803 family)
MTNTAQVLMSGGKLTSRKMFFALAVICTLTSVAVPRAQAQTFSVLHTFTGETDGANPMAGVTLDEEGHLYGTTYFGGTHDCGVVFKLSHQGSGWVLTSLYSFAGNTLNDGCEPAQRVIFGPDGRLYGTTFVGGVNMNLGLGTIFRLSPPATACKSVSCPWTETVLHSFTGTNGGSQLDGAYPIGGDLTFNAADTIYGTTTQGGSQAGGYCQNQGCGTVYELNPNNLNESVIYDFGAGSLATPYGGVVRDSANNLYGTASAGGIAWGAVYELTQNNDGVWSQNTIYNFQDLADGAYPIAGLWLDGSGRLYGASSQGSFDGGGEAFELSPSGGGWTFNNVHGFDSGPEANLTMDASGNLYGTAYRSGGCGAVFKLTPNNGGFTYTALHVFSCGSDGSGPISNVVMDSAGNLYGTTSGGGLAGGCFAGEGCGVVWEIAGVGAADLAQPISR